MSYCNAVILQFAFVAGLSATPVVAAPPIRLTTDGQQKMDPVFVADGSEIVYAVQASFDQISLMRLNVAQRTVEPFNPGAPTSELCATFSNDEQTRAFIRNNANLHVLLVIQNMADGSTVEHDPGGGFAGVNCISMAPDGSSGEWKTALPIRSWRACWPIRAARCGSEPTGRVCIDSSMVGLSDWIPVWTCRSVTSRACGSIGKGVFGSGPAAG